LRSTIRAADNVCKKDIIFFIEEILHPLFNNTTGRNVVFSNRFLHLSPKFGIDLAIIDGNLNEWDSNGADGQAVLAAIRSKAPGVKIVGVSVLSLSVPGADAQVSKKRIEKLGEVVKNL